MSVQRESTVSTVKPRFTDARLIRTPHCYVAWENIHFSSLFVAGDVSRRGTSATQRQKFHTDDIKSVRNPVRSADWSMEQSHCFSYCLRMTDKRHEATKVKCKREESLTKQPIFVEYSLLQKKHLSFAGARGQINTTLYQNRPEDTQNWTNLHLEPHDYWIYYVRIDLGHQYGISVAEWQTFLRAKRPTTKSEEKRMFLQANYYGLFSLFPRKALTLVSLRSDNGEILRRQTWSRGLGVRSLSQWREKQH